MYLYLFLKSFFTGFFAACLVGPVFTLILYRTVTGGFKSGILSATGMAMADGLFFSLSVISNLYTNGILLSNLKALEIIGGPLMITFGLWTLFKRSVSQENKNSFLNNSILWQPLSVFFLTLSNPLTLLFFGSMINQIYPELIYASYKLIFLSSFFVSCGSFSLLLIAIILTKWQKHFNAESLVNFFKILSGVGLLFTGSLLSLKTWCYFKNKVIKTNLSKQKPEQNKLISIIKR